MACSKSSSVVVASLLLLLGGPGCKGDEGRFPPPSPATSTGVGGGGTGGEGGGPVTPPNVCECAYSAIVDDECGFCVNGAAANECITEGLACDGDPGCEALGDCPAKCNPLPQDEKPACVQKCVLDNQDSASFPLYVALMECVCAPCAEHCAPAEPLACQ